MYPEVALLSSELPLKCPEVTYPRWLKGCLILLRIKWGLNTFGFKCFSGLCICYLSDFILNDRQQNTKRRWKRRWQKFRTYEAVCSCEQPKMVFCKLFWPTVRKSCSSDREKHLKFEAEGRGFSKFLRLLKQFIQTVNGQNIFW